MLWLRKFRAGPAAAGRGGACGALEFVRTAITLHTTDVVRLGAARGRPIESLLGRVWVTLDGDPRDIVLDPGAGFNVDRDSDVLISPLRGDARFVVLDRVHAA